jgi:dihydroorotase/N-acyl-D-amino-acid deacylase
MSERGVLSEGMIADIVVFDPETVADRATFQDPHQYPAGIDFVLINGIVAVDSGVFSDTRSGRMLRR